MSDSRYSDNDVSKRDIPSFIEPRPPLISNPFMRPRPQKGTNLLELFEEDSECEEPELVQVYLRLKPCNIRNNLYEVRSDRCLLTSLDTTTAGHGRRTQHNVSKMYTFSHIFGPEASQNEIFEHVVKNNLKKLPEGHSFTLLTYGASGSGKTYTLMGTVASPGLVPRSLEYVFKVVDAAQQPLFKPAEGIAEKLSSVEQEYELQWVNRLRSLSAPLRDKYRRMSVQLGNDFSKSNLNLSNRSKHYVWVSFIEIYNEGIYDLLMPCDRRPASKLTIREDSNGNVYVKGATQAFVRSGEEAYDVMVAGKHHLQVAATGVHAGSSRSHCIFTITMLTETESGVSGACVRLCDLAGCERAARTRNTGARMLESRAINSSLHVLERCLHTLRRRRRAPRALVPYRESKLTRLLGAGLSGARGEAVSMVVTLNPAPQDAAETRHVLQLATVARDIQINNTLLEYPSSLESSTQDTTTIGCSSEVMKLRADNERLRFELVQAHARNNELVASMDERQAAAAETLQELVHEAREITKQYYEMQLENINKKMEEMVEEYESRLNNDQQASGDNSKIMQNQINQLLIDITILEEKLTAEQLARERAEQEIQHLRACIEERDEKTDEDDAQEDVVSVDTDSSEEEDDPYNESLEPTFTKEDISRSRLLQKSILSEHSIYSEHSKENLDESVLGKLNSTLKDNNIVSTATDNIKNSSHEPKTLIQSATTSAIKINVYSRTEPFAEEKSYFNTNDENLQETTNTTNQNSNNNETFSTLEKSLNRQTYNVKKSKDDNLSDLNLNEHKSLNQNSIIIKDKNGENEENNYKMGRPSANFVNTILNSLKKTSEINNSLAQFERLEMATRISKNKKNKDISEIKDIQIPKEKRKYFEEVDNNILSSNNIVEEKKSFFDNLDAVNISNDKLNKINYKPDNYNNNKPIDYCRSPSIVREGTTNDLEHNRFKILFGESFTRTEPSLSVDKINYLTKKQDSIDLFEGSPLIIKKVDIIDIKKLRESIKNIEISQPKLTKELGSNLEKVESQTLEVEESLKELVNEKTSSVKKSISVKSEENDLKSIQDDCLKNTPSTDILFKHIEEPDISPKNNKSNDIPKADIKPLEFVETNVSGMNKELENEETIANTTPVCQDLKSLLKTNESDMKIVQSPKKCLDVKTKVIPEPLTKPAVEVASTVNTVSQLDITNNKVNNTLEEFENIYKSVSIPRVTEFEALVSEDNTQRNVSAKNNELSLESEETKYNLRRKRSEKNNNKCLEGEIIMENISKCKSVAKSTKKSLRLRRQNNRPQVTGDVTTDQKLKDIVNLQTQFSDVLLDIPVTEKIINDIPSPEKKEDENIPPMLGIQSCPSKSVQRSRRKLFTPRAEPLEESGGGAGADSGEPVRVPRPSYHRPRARRRL